MTEPPLLLAIVTVEPSADAVVAPVAETEAVVARDEVVAPCVVREMDMAARAKIRIVRVPLIELTDMLAPDNNEVPAGRIAHSTLPHLREPQPVALITTWPMDRVPMTLEVDDDKPDS